MKAMGLLTLIIVVIAGCGPSPSHRMHTPRREIEHAQPAQTFDTQKFYLKHGVNAVSIFKPCPTYTGSNRKFVGHAAMLVALNQAGWIIELHLAEEHSTRAYACLRNHPENCGVMVFLAQENGEVVAGDDPGTPIRENLKDDRQRWLIALQQKYARTRCYTEDALKEEMVKFGYQLASTAGDQPDGGTESEEPDRTVEQELRRVKHRLGALRTAGLLFRVDHPDKCPSFDNLADAGLLYSREALAKDPWGNPYVIECVGEEAVVVTSLGPDGQRGTDDDIVDNEPAP